MRRIKYVLTVFCLIGLAASASAIVFESATIEELSDESSLIVHGIVEEQDAQWEGNNIYTYSELRILETLKGTVDGNSVTIRELGGQVGEVAARVNGVSYVTPNEELVLFLRPTEQDGVYKIHSFMLGKFLVKGKSKSGKSVYHELGDKDLIKKTDAIDYHQNMRLEVFKASVIEYND